jgi:hypothetical protein
VNIGEDSKVVDSTLTKDDCIYFFEGNDRYDINNIPNFLKSELSTIYSKIEEVESFEICKDKKITIKNNRINEGLIISHLLIWNTKQEEDYEFVKNRDMILNKDVVYRIGLTEHHGH